MANAEESWELHVGPPTVVLPWNRGKHRTAGRDTFALSSFHFTVFNAETHFGDLAVCLSSSDIRTDDDIHGSRSIQFCSRLLF